MLVSTYCLVYLVVGAAVVFLDDETSYQFVFDLDVHLPLYQALRFGAASSSARLPASFDASAATGGSCNRQLGKLWQRKHFNFFRFDIIVYSFKNFTSLPKNN